MPVFKRAWVLSILFFLVLSPAFADPMEHRLAEGIEWAKRATVGVLDESFEGRGGGVQARFSLRGSGFHVREGYIVTARHAVDRQERNKRVIPQQITILTADLEELTARLTGVNTFLDIAVYRVNGDGAGSRMGTVSFAKEEPQPGDEVYTIGYPLGWGPAVGFGRIGNPNTFLPTIESRLFQIDLSACSGNSGGGLFNARGEVVGVVHAIIQTETAQAERRCSRFAFSVPGPLVQRIVTALIQGAKPQFSRLGINLKPVKMGTRWQLAVADAVGPALEGGIQKGDILIAIDSTDITDAAQFKTYLIERTEPGQRVAVRVLRDGKEQIVTVVLGGG